jgi:hypothetical protein
MIRPPSNAKQFDAFYSKDPAFVQLADDASEDDGKEHAQKWRTARQTGDYSALLIEGQQPTKFTLRPLSVDAFASIIDMKRSGTGDNEVAILAFRVALKSVSNFGKAEIKFGPHKKFGLIASTDFLDKAGLPAGLALNIAAEIGGVALEKAMDISPL